MNPQALEDPRLSDLAGPEVPFFLDPRLAAEAFELTLGNSGPRLRAGSTVGVLHGLHRLRDEVARAGGQIPSHRIIADGPALAHRGFMADISRNRVWTMDFLKTLVRQMARLGYNHLQLYTEHTFAYTRHRQVWEHASALNASEVADLAAYAADRGIALAANQNSYGHLDRWLRHPDYRPLAEIDGGFTEPWGVYRPYPSTLSPAVEGTYGLLDELYGELFPLCPSPWANLGGDEPWEHCQGKAKDLGPPARVYADHLARIAGLARNHGKAAMVWGDIIVQHPEQLGRLPADLVFVEWGYEHDSPFDAHAKLFADHSRAFWVSPGTSSWHSLGGRWKNARANIGHALDAARDHGGQGLLLTDWGDNGHWQQPVFFLPALVLAGAKAWNFSADPDDRVVADLMVRKLGLDRAEAEAVLALGSVPQNDRFQILNTTLSNACVMDHFYPCYRQAFPGARRYSFVEDRKAVDTALAGVTGASDVSDQLRFTGRFLKATYDYAEAWLATPEFQSGQIPVPERKRLAAAFTGLVHEFEELWLRHTRPGGLGESTALLRGVADELS